MIGTVRKEQRLPYVFSPSICPTTEKQFLDYVRAELNYVVKLLQKLAKSNLHLAMWCAVPLRTNKKEAHWRADYLEVFLIQIRRYWDNKCVAQSWGPVFP